jgi:hypothetical protein
MNFRNIIGNSANSLPRTFDGVGKQHGAVLDNSVNSDYKALIKGSRTIIVRDDDRNQRGHKVLSCHCESGGGSAPW